MKALRKPLSLFMAMLMCLGIFAGTGTTAFAAGETMTTYMVEFPRASDPNKAGWGHSAMNFLGGWSTGENNGFTIHTQDSFNGKVIYCIEPGVSVHSGDQFTGRGEDFWDDYPSDLNPTIPPDTIKEYIGRIMTYGWQGNASTSWMTDDPEDASKMAGAIATQLLVWETVVGERDSQFNHVDANAQGKNNIAEYTSPENPLYSEIFSQYSAIESAVKRHTMLPSFFSSTADAGAYELKWDGQQLEFNQKYNSLSGTPQGGIISPILANIYLHEFDKFMEGISAEYTKGKQRRPYREYQILQYKRNRAKKKGNQEQADEYLRQMQNIPALDPMDKNYQRVKYVRYADDFVVCIIGSKATANEIKERIAGFMQKELHLELSREKTKITNLSDKRVRFLGYEITKSQENTKQVVDSIGRKKRSVNGTIQLVVPGDVIREKLKPFIKKGKPYQVGARVNLPVIEIISQYNAEIRGLYNYYCLATDVSTKISTFQYYHYFSMIKTIARKEKSSVKKVIQKYGIDVPRKNGTGTMRIVGIRYNTKEGPKTMTYFNDSLKKVSRPAGEISDQFGQVLKGGQLMKRLNSDVCELCGAEHCALEIHHVRKLKDIVKKYRKRGTPMPNWVWLMSYMKRKTLVLCHDCHVNLHNGTL